jgi:hypothetical protein
MKLTTIVLPAVLVVLLCLATTVALRQSGISADIQPLPNELLGAAVVQGTGERGPVRMIRFVLLDNGVYPRQMRVQQGLINLAVEDETGVSEGLAVERVVNSDRERITTIRRRPEVRRGRELMRLTSGQYIVYDASKPNNKANLLVEP